MDFSTIMTSVESKDSALRKKKNSSGDGYDWCGFFHILGVSEILSKKYPIISTNGVPTYN